MIMNKQEADMTAQELAEYIIQNTKDFFGNRAESFNLEHADDVPWKVLAFTFKAYRKFTMRFSYERGSFGYHICEGKFGYSIPTSIKWYEVNLMSQILADTKRDLELRLPDEYLIENGWLSN